MREIVLNAEWTVYVDESGERLNPMISIDRHLPGRDPITFQLWAYDLELEMWEFMERHCEDLPLPEDIGARFYGILLVHGFPPEACGG